MLNFTELKGRVMTVLDPLKITIENYPNSGPTKISVPDFPNKPELRSHDIIFDQVIYIERNDFMEVGDKGYRRLTKTQSVGLRYAGFTLEVKEIEKDKDGNISNIICTCTNVDQVSTKPKAFIHWVAQPLTVEVRIYKPLFKHKNPEDTNEVPGGFLSDITPDSLLVMKSYADQFLSKAKVYNRYQFERIGFFSVDPDTTANKLVFNQTVGLKEDTGKQ